MSEFRFLDFPILRFPLSPILRFSDFPHPPAPHSPLHHYPFFIAHFTFYIPNPQSSVLPRHAGQARSSTHETRNLKRETPPSAFPIGPELMPKGRFPDFPLFRFLSFPRSSVFSHPPTPAPPVPHFSLPILHFTFLSTFPIGPELVPLDVARNGVVSLPNPPKGRFPDFPLFHFIIHRSSFILSARLPASCSPLAALIDLHRRLTRLPSRHTLPA